MKNWIKKRYKIFAPLLPSKGIFVKGTELILKTTLQVGTHGRTRSLPLLKHTKKGNFFVPWETSPPGGCPLPPPARFYSLCFDREGGQNAIIYVRPFFYNNNPLRTNWGWNPSSAPTWLTNYCGWIRCVYLEISGWGETAALRARRMPLAGKSPVVLPLLKYQACVSLRTFEKLQ